MSGIDIRGTFKAAGNFPIFQGWEVKGGLHVVMSRSDRNAIPSRFRVLDNNRTTLVYVVGDDLYRLVNNPSTENTTDSDWEVAIQSVNSQPETPVGVWNINNSSPTLQDSSYAGNTGDYYWVAGAPNDTQITINGLFGDSQVTVKDGDQVIYAVNKWFVRRNNLTISIPDELLVPQYVADIAERNALNRYTGMRVIVQDAGDDPELQAGVSAEYLYQPNNVNADSQGFIRLNNPSLSPTGQIIVTPSNNIMISGPGTYVYTGAGAAVWTLPELISMTLGAEIRVKNLSSDDSDLDVVIAGGTDDVINKPGVNTRNIFTEEKVFFTAVDADKWIT